MVSGPKQILESRCVFQNWVLQLCGGVAGARLSGVVAAGRLGSVVAGVRLSGVVTGVRRGVLVHASARRSRGDLRHISGRLSLSVSKFLPNAHRN